MTVATSGVLINTSVLLYVDIFFKLIVILDYYFNGDVAWFSFSVGFLVLPSVVVALVLFFNLSDKPMASISGERQELNCHSSFGDKICLFFRNLLLVQLLRETIRALDVLELEETPNAKNAESSDKSSQNEPIVDPFITDALISPTRSFRVYLDSAPQAVLQAYVSLNLWQQLDRAPFLEIASFVFSFFSVSAVLSTRLALMNTTSPRLTVVSPNEARGMHGVEMGQITESPLSEQTPSPASERPSYVDSHADPMWSKSKFSTTLITLFVAFDLCGRALVFATFAVCFRLLMFVPLAVEWILWTVYILCVSRKTGGLDSILDLIRTRVDGQTSSQRELVPAPTRAKLIFRLGTRSLQLIMSDWPMQGISVTVQHLLSTVFHMLLLAIIRFHPIARLEYIVGGKYFVYAALIVWISRSLLFIVVVRRHFQHELDVGRGR